MINEMHIIYNRLKNILIFKFYNYGDSNNGGLGNGCGNDSGCLNGNGYINEHSWEKNNSEFGDGTWYSYDSGILGLLTLEEK